MRAAPNKITPVHPSLAPRFQSLPFVGRITEVRRSDMHTEQDPTRRREAAKRVKGIHYCIGTSDTDHAFIYCFWIHSLFFASLRLRVRSLPICIVRGLHAYARTWRFSELAGTCQFGGPFGFGAVVLSAASP